MKNKEKYREFCKRELDIPIFSQDWWLDTVCVDGEWDVVLVEKGGEIVASMPYYIKKEGFFNTITMPPFTQKMGPYIKYPEGQKYYKRLSWEKEIMNSLIEQIPYYDVFNQTFDYTITNWLPFYWKGFNSSLRYTYILEDISDIDIVTSNFSHAKRKQIKKAIKNNIKIKIDDLSLIDFYNLHKKELESEGSEISYSFDMLESLYSIAKDNNSIFIVSAEDEKSNIHGALFLVYDNNCVYNLISAFNPNFLNSGASSLLVLEAIKYAKSIGKNRFDFEGSMIEGVENSFRQFGSIQKPYLQIYKTNSKLWRFKNIFDKVFK